jgi:hypothetical protein
MTTKEILKQTLISIAIGTIISFLTVLFQETITWLRHIQPEIPGTVVGIGKYLHTWNSHQNV